MTCIKEQPFLPIIIQSGQYAYRVARSFYEAYRIKSLVIEPTVKGATMRSLFWEAHRNCYAK